MIPPWVAYVAGAWGMVAAALLFINWPFIELDRLDRGKVIRDCLGWPWWFLVIMVEATEEARRRIK